ncbi:hypothetical protein SAMN05518846_11734 [Brevibacillus centrosporus]|uniref:Uncharacterized protein n=1 Tax=Brevibacillus centrosporus TaxID=54910 RepID=A0A1I4BBY4_9BACL|nr:hypothetical protein SAMN05518846_11734 [Brevibacillus centrosporus]
MDVLFLSLNKVVTLVRSHFLVQWKEERKWEHILSARREQD